MEQKIGNDTGRSQVNAESFLEELKPLIEDFFVFDLEKGENFLSVRFENGQTIRLMAKETEN